MIDNSGEVLDEMIEKAVVGMTAVGLKAEGYAKEECPVDTGRLRNSITNQVQKEGEEIFVYIGTNVDYGAKVELDDRTRHVSGKAHFLRDSVANHGKEYKDLIDSALKG